MKYLKIKIYLIFTLFLLVLVIFNPFYGILASIVVVLLTKRFEVFSKRWILFSAYLVIFYYFIMGQDGLNNAYRLLAYIFAVQWFINSVSIEKLVEFVLSYNRDLGIGIWMTFSTLEVAKREFETTKNAQLSRGLNKKGLINKYRSYYAIISPLIVKLYISAINRARSLLSKCYE
ncbi:energy-coupling factor transporter transmembrane protein EcfT [Methanococcus maripaludis]|uniref:Energy-coupling factor transporter transmembrane protein EcfT n=1 Tax=Methanococcus maripaludis TaxID=39152 RepID=A0A7J9P5I9_METMI|nr:energy-coupling factor transporter transmembrane component T [Methanococcus maripaludis]MBA2853376.1 energy-coupling factor transporter transmembrane protein EcfT [Methanococcus maripaludis]